VRKITFLSPGECYAGPLQCQKHQITLAEAKLIELQKEFFQPCIRVIVNAKKQRFSGDYEADYLVDCYVICDTISACIKGINNKLKEGIL